MRFFCVVFIALFCFVNITNAQSPVFNPEPNLSYLAVGQNEMRIMSFNAFMGGSGLHHYSLRRDLLFQTLEDYKPDIVAFQETPHDTSGSLYDPENPDVDTILNDILYNFSDFTRVPLSSPDIHNEEIIYRPDRFDVVSSDTAIVTDFGFPIICQITVQQVTFNFFRYVSRVLFEEKGTGERFYVYNVHLCPSQQSVRELHVDFLIDRINSQTYPSLPTFVAGDFNNSEDSVEVLDVKDQNFIDSFRDFNPDSEFQGTWNGFHQTIPSIISQTSSDKIDYLFFRDHPDVDVMSSSIYRFLVIEDNGGGSSDVRYSSDHYPVEATVKVPEPAPLLGLYYSIIGLVVLCRHKSRKSP